MTQQSARLQSFNTELVQCLDELCQRRKKLEKEIDKEQHDKLVLEAQLQALREKLERVNGSVAAKLATKAEFDKTIADSEQAYIKILESSQVLLNVVKKESAALTQMTVSSEKSRCSSQNQ